MKVLPAISQDAVKRGEPYFVAILLDDAPTYRLIESTYYQTSADRAAKILQDHADKNGLQHKYVVLHDVNSWV